LSTNGFQGNQLSSALILGTSTGPERFGLIQGSQEAAAINADGSGSFTFLDWQAVTPFINSVPQNENGTITWTCQTET
jgi:hypothetical protein